MPIPEQQVSQGLSAYLVMMAPITPFLHLAYIVFLLRLILYASWVRSPFEWFVTLNYAMFIYLPFGWIWTEVKRGSPFMFIQKEMEQFPFWRFGSGFGFSVIHFILMVLVTYQWFQEAKDPQNEYDFRGIPFWRWWVVPVIAWGFFYPLIPWQGPDRFEFIGWTFLWSSPFGILFAPTTIFFLGLFSLIFPKVNLKLFLVLNGVALVVAFHTFFFSSLDLPMAGLALYNLGLFARHKLRKGVMPAPSF
jgi:hypothetical protein